MHPESDLPAIVVEEFSQTRAPRQRATNTDRAAVVVAPPGYELVKKLAIVVSTVKHDYARTIGTHRAFHPRIHSRVEHRIDERAADALESLRRRETVEVCVGPLRLSGDTTHVHYDVFEHEYRLPCRLHLPLSWPELPMWLSIAEITANRGALRLSLRSRRRLRYPIRYFHAAHAVLTGLESRLVRSELRCPTDDSSGADDRRRGRHDHEQQS